jgi:diadenosine tetraphosphatase ApaH/serine/threonine PP2A family protein phosphatase
LILALLSDIHGNLEALNACLRHARGAGADRFAFLGDYVGYGADASGVMEIVMSHVAEGAVAVRGNHDAAVNNPATYMEDSAKEAIDWARETMSEEQKRFLAGLPLIVREDPICFVHASAVTPERWVYVNSPASALECANAAGCTYTFCGHLHGQRLYFESREGSMSEFQPVPGTAIPVRAHRRWVAVVGSVGQPRDRVPAAAYALFNTARGELTFLRVPYDQMAAAQKIRAAGLPLDLARRVELGI